MKKETSIAIIFGIVMGGILAVFILTKNKATRLEKTKTIAPSITITPKTAVNNTTTQPLELTQPQDNSVVYKNSVTLSGKAPTGAVIMIQSPIKDSIVKNDKDQFNIDFPLAFGENTITFTVYSKDTTFKIQQKTLRIYYLDEQL
jgi:hypothetical protein